MADRRNAEGMAFGQNWYPKALRWLVLGSLALVLSACGPVVIVDRAAVIRLDPRRIGIVVDHICDFVPCRCPNPGNWQTVAPMPTARAYLAAAERAGRFSFLHALGGNNGQDVLPTVEGYQADAFLWRTLPPMLTARDGLAAVWVGGALFAVGGFGGPGTGRPARILPTLEKFDPVTNSWISRLDMPTARMGLAAVELGGKLFVVGGQDAAGQFLSTLEMFDPANDVWVPRASMSRPRAWLAAAAIDGKLYAVGGGGPGEQGQTLEVYDPVADTWEFRTPMLTGRVGLAAAEYRRKLYVVGGYGKGRFMPLWASGSDQLLSMVEVYDPATNRWCFEPDIPTPRVFLAAVRLFHRIPLFEGFEVVPGDPRRGLPRTGEIPVFRETIVERLYALGGVVQAGDRSPIVEAYPELPPPPFPPR